MAEDPGRFGDQAVMAATGAGDFIAWSRRSGSSRHCFLFMLPLHEGQPQRQRMMYLTGLRLLNDVL